MNIPRILFVDDEPDILDGLEDVLRAHRRRWKMAFALGGHAALAELERSSFDVIVSDMRMPGMAGSELLERVRASYPHIARIVLSGHADRASVLRTLPVAHQFLAKPCDVDTLRGAIDRVCAFQALVNDERVRRVVGRLDRLPPVPRTYLELDRAVAEPNVGIAEIARIVEADPAMAAKVLQLVNSAYFGITRQVSSVSTGVAYLGIDLVKGLALTAHVFATMENRVDPSLLERVQRESLRAAHLTRRFMSGHESVDAACTAALLHGVGELVLAAALPDVFEATTLESRQKSLLPHVLEEQRPRVSAPRVGAYLLGVWGLPVTVVDCVAHHREPASSTAGDVEVLAAVHVAAAFAGGSDGAECQSRLDHGFLGDAGFADRLPAWHAIAAATVPTKTRS